MNDSENVVNLLKEIKRLLFLNKKVFNVEDLASYTGLSKSKIYDLTHLKKIPTGNNKDIRQKFFDREVIEEWLMGYEESENNEDLENQLNLQLLKNKKA
ncbi:helix-turn-helix transcriptional regulator [Joostella sp. CR20]|uniref:helix-turn-helix transcriptional regulator n=1 Tax=Joostella sp. CR20 TaxID=2804312 RepID=UPI00313DFA91